MDAPAVLTGSAPERHIGYVLARRAPWLFHFIIWLARNPHRNPERFQQQFGAGAAPCDLAIMARPEFKAMMVRNYAQATRAGVRGFVHEVALAARPWGFRLEDITLPVRLWHGEEDRSTPIGMARYMASTLPNCHATFLPGEGHLFLFDRWGEILGDLTGDA